MLDAGKRRRRLSRRSQVASRRSQIGGKASKGLPLSSDSCGQVLATDRCYLLWARLSKMEGTETLTNCEIAAVIRFGRINSAGLAFKLDCCRKRSCFRRAGDVNWKVQINFSSHTLSIHAAI